MDNYWDKNRFSNYFLTMANLEANKLVNIASTISLVHLKDGILRMKFRDEVRDYATLQLNTIRSSTNDE